MWIKMKFAVLVAYAFAIANPSCGDAVYADNGDGACPPGGECSSGTQCSGEACCGDAGLSSYPGTLSCRTEAPPCFRRSALKEEDDFDSLDDLELAEQGGQ